MLSANLVAAINPSFYAYSFCGYYTPSSIRRQIRGRHRRALDLSGFLSQGEVQKLNHAQRAAVPAAPILRFSASHSLARRTDSLDFSTTAG
jgi:hypothetical protein